MLNINYELLYEYFYYYAVQNKCSVPFLVILFHQVCLLQNVQYQLPVKIWF